MSTSPESTTKPSPQLEEKKVFEVHLDALKDAYKELIDMTQKIILILLAVVGWFATKDDPLPILCRVPYLAHIAILFTVAGLFISAHLFNIVHRRADASVAALLQLGFDSTLFLRYRITKSMYWASLFGQFTLFLGIVAFLAVKYIDTGSKICEH